MTVELTDLLERHRTTLVRFFEDHGRYLQRYEGADDLAQGVHLHAVRYADRFEYRGEKPFLGWLLRLARQHLAHRIAHWKAAKRDAGPMLRITLADATAGGGVHPAASVTGPVTYASRREELHVATLAMEGLPPRDREIVRLLGEGGEVADIAAQLRISPAAAQRARHRAVERFRMIYDIVNRKREQSQQ